jgi:SAM-dependent methyltransferase
MATTRRVYREQAAFYDRVRKRDGAERPWLAQLRRLIPEPADILDLGCGNGEPFTRPLLEAGANLTGVDFSPEMIALCKDRYPNATWIEQDLRRLDLAPAQYDGIICWGTIFHLRQDDQRRLIPKMATLLKPGGVLLMTSGDTAGESEGYIGDTRIYHASFSVEGYKDALNDAGLNNLDVSIGDEASGGATVYLAQKPY